MSTYTKPKSTDPNQSQSQTHATNPEVFCYLMVSFLLEVYCEAYKIVYLQITMHESHTVLVPKRNDRDKLRKVVVIYRPISLGL